MSLSFSGVSTTSPAVASPPVGVLTSSYWSKSASPAALVDDEPGRSSASREVLPLPLASHRWDGGEVGRARGVAETRVARRKRDVLSRNSAGSVSHVRISMIGGGSIGRRSAGQSA